MKEHAITFRLDEELWRKLSKLHRVTGAKKADILRDALKQYEPKAERECAADK